MSEKNEKVFRGVWIPVEIWETHTLSWMEKCLWAEISSLGTKDRPCFASNAFLAVKFNSTESSISNMISRLKSMGMIKHISYDGRSRKMIATLPNDTSPASEVRVNPKVKSDFTSECNRDTKVVTSREQPLPLHKGDEEKVEELFPNEPSSAPSSPMIAARSAMASRPKAIPENLTAFQARANRLLGRRESTKWASNEIKAAANWLDTSEEEWKLLEGFYANRGKDGYYCRTTMITLLNNWSSEIDKARSKQTKHEEESWKPTTI